MKTSLIMPIVLLMPLVCVGADTPFDIKPGLWDISSTTQMSGMPPIPNLDQMTPEQRARVEGAMKRMSGAPHTTTRKQCITKESIEKDIADASSSKNGCSPKITTMSASKVVLRLDCAQEKEAKSSGDVVIERVDSEHIKGNGTVTSSSGGRTVEFKWSMTGAFVSSNCGNIKPEGQ